MVGFSLKELKCKENVIKDFIRVNGRPPNFVRLMEMGSGKLIKLGLEEVMGTYYSMYMFWLKNGRFPNFVTANVRKHSSMILNFQDNKYNCGPASMSMISTKLFNPVEEHVLAKVFKTNKNGTTPANIVNRGGNVGFNVKRIPRNPGAVRTALSKYNGVLCHYETGAARCAGFKNNYGHYAVISDLDHTEYTIYDPTRGVFKCKTVDMDNATHGRDLGYYGVGLL